MKKRFFVTLFGSLILVFIASSAFYLAVCDGLRKTTRDTVGKFNYVIGDTTYYNTVFFGSSRTNTHVNAILFDSIAKTKSFNAGQDGMVIAEINVAIRKFVASHGAPKNLFINVDIGSLTERKGVWYFPQYYPYINDTILGGLAEIEPRLNLGKYLPAAATTYFDDPLKNLGLSAFLGNDKRGIIPFRGFQPIYNHKITDDRAASSVNFEITEDGWKKFEQTILFCKEHHIKVYLFVSPIYRQYFGEAAFQVFRDRIKEVSPDYAISVFTFEDDNRFKDKDNFANTLHLNYEGANLFTAELARKFLNDK